MRLTVLVKPNSRRPGVEKLPTGEYRVQVAAPPQDGKANEAVLRALAEHLGYAPSRLRILSGFTGKRKIVEVSE